MDELVLLDRTIGMQEAQKVILGYCFHVAPSEKPWTPKGPNTFGPGIDSLESEKWAYRFYDCAPRSPGTGIGIADVLAAGALQLKLGFETIRAVASVLSQVSEAVGKVQAPDFWSLDPSDLPEDGSAPPEGRDGWLMGRAWWLLMGIPKVDIATTHKVLHHKWPMLFPVIDGETRKLLREEDREPVSLWRAIFDDLTSNPEAWESLEKWFEGQARKRNGVPLTRLRLHDILLWCKATDEWDDAREAGASLND